MIGAETPNAGRAVDEGHVLGARAIGPIEVQSVAIGCMSLTGGYGPPSTRERAAALLHRALDLGYDFVDTASMYGDGANETLVGEVLGAHRSSFSLASKCGMSIVDGQRRIDGSPKAVHAVLDESLRRLRTDRIDLYYLHRLDPQVPVEETVGALADAVNAGKIRAIGLSEVDAGTLRRAYAVHPVAALQSEYSLWTRNPEIAVLDACAELGTAFVAFSPLGRGFLTDKNIGPETIGSNDLRKTMPRFMGSDWSRNRQFLLALRSLAEEAGITTAQLSLAWVLQTAPHVIALTGTQDALHLESNFRARDLVLSADVVARAEAIVHSRAVHGHRYPETLRGLALTEEETR